MSQLERMEVYRYTIEHQPCTTELGPGLAVEIEFSPFWWYTRKGEEWFRYGVILEKPPFHNSPGCLAYFKDSEVTITRGGNR